MKTRRPIALLFVLFQMVAGTASYAQSEQAIPNQLSETYGSWIVKCQSQAVEKNQPQVQQCEMVQEHFQSENGKRVLAISVRTEEGNATLTFVTPFGLLLSAGIELRLLDQSLVKSEFKTCLPVGCIAITSMPLEEIKTLSQETELRVMMVTIDNQVLVTKVPLDGFASALNRLSSF